jgi:anti-sigma factor RsiW
MFEEIMTCEDVNRLLSSRQDKELSAARIEEVDAHLGSCRECRAEFDALKRLRLELDRWTDIEPETDFPARIMERLQPKRETTSSTIPSFVYSFAFLVVFLFGFLLSMPGKRQPAPEKKIMDLSAMLAGIREMGLSSVQDQTIRLIQGGLLEKK